jgi:predicted RNA methylase
MTDKQREQLIQNFSDRLIAGESFASITVARKAAQSILGIRIKAGDAAAKTVDEAMEAAVVRTATQLVQDSNDTHAAYDRLVDLMERQPRLGVKTTTSVLQQAYSTPIPIAFLAATLADIGSEDWVYEPTAGNGALLISANPAKVIANELNPDRAAELQNRGFASLNQADATAYLPTQQVDRVIMNPPFGSVDDGNGSKKIFQMFEISTQQIDRAIAAHGLRAMKDDGRAVLILGSNPGRDEAARSQHYHSRGSRGFFKQLYEQYNVTDHFTISGDLYRKQGAGFPIDIVVIEGRGKSRRKLPAADVPVIYNSFEQLKQEKLPNAPIRKLSEYVDTERGRSDSILRESPRTVSDLQPDTISKLHGTAASSPDRGSGGGEFPARSTEIDGGQAGIIRSGKGTTRLGIAQLEPELGGSPDSLQRDFLGQAGDWSGGISSNTTNVRIEAIPNATGYTRGNNPRDLAERAEVSLMTSTTPEITEATKLNDLVEAKQIPYQPRSGAPAIGTLIPTNMAAPAQAALDRFEQKHGNVDDFLVDRLNYADRDDLYKHFSAEQVDGAALAIASIETGEAFVNGYQTGIGKGRICAAIMRYAKEEGKDAVFVTQNAGLYADMIRDTSDIGMQGFNPFITDNNKKIDFPDGRSIRSGDGDERTAGMQQIINGEANYDAIFTSYTQLQTVKGEEPYRREFLRELAPRSILILDEAHEAGGTSQGDFGKVNAVPNRAEFVRELVDLSNGAYFSSATAIKRPDVIDLYARKTGLRDAVEDMDALQDVLEVGGVPLQQMVAAGLAEGGDMLRLERSMVGISFNPKVVLVDRSMAENLATSMRAIRDFDEAKNRSVKAMDEELKEAGEQIRADNAVGDRGMKSTNFTSLMHNVISQGLMSMKAEATVQACIEALEQGQKPVIALDNTMGSAIEWHAKTNEIQPGEEVDLSFGDLLVRYLDRSREVIVQDWSGESERRELTKEELGPTAFQAYVDARKAITESDFSAMPISPIDYIKHRLEQEGYNVGEVTGRQHIVNYADDGSMIYATRSTRETNTNAKNHTVGKFNSGELDVVILNRSGSTGISLHASEKFTDQKPRHMLMLQPNSDINQTMQMFGRINRTGQVELPQYTLLMSDLPAEKRPGAILARKMASLNANTTAARESDLSIKDVVDFFNPYGEAVVRSVLREDPELDAMLGSPYEKWAEGGDTVSKTSLIEKVTGRIPILPLADQEALYEKIETGYRDLLATKQALGQNDLEAGRLDLDAKPLAVMEVAEATGDGPFRAAVRVEVLDIKASYKPPTTERVLATLRDTLTLDEATPNLPLGANIREIQKAGREYSDLLRDGLNESTAAYLENGLATKSEESAEKFTTKVSDQRRYIAECLQEYPVGTIVEMETSGGSQYGVVSDIYETGQTKNPAATSNWRMDITTPFSSRPIAIAFSQIEQDNHSIITKMPGMENAVLKDFDRYQVEARTQVQMVTGNLIAGFNKFPKGRFVNFTTQDGDVRQGLMLPFDTDVAKELAAQPVKMPDVATSQAYLNEWTNQQGWLKTNDLNFRVGSDRNGGLRLVADSARIKGGKYYLDQDICNAAGKEFVSSGNHMQMTVPKEQVESVLAVIQAKHPLYAHSHNEIAKERLGIATKTFVAVEDIPKTIVPESPAIEVEAAPSPPESLVISTSIIEPESIEQTVEPEASPMTVEPEPLATASLEMGAGVSLIQTDLFGNAIVIQEGIVEAATITEAEVIPIPTRDRSNAPIQADERISAEVIQAFRKQFDVGLVNPEAVETYLFETLPQALDADQSWQNVKWSDQSEDEQKVVLAGVIDRFNNTGDNDLQQLMSQPEFVDWLNNALFESDTNNFSVEYEFDAADLTSAAETEVYAESLTQWQEKAQAIGRSPEYLTKVGETVTTALSTGILTAKADEARQIDGQVWLDMVQGTIKNAEAVVELAGTTTESSKSFVGKIYRVDQTSDSLSIQAKDRGEILRVEQGEIATATVTATDAEKFQQQNDYLKARQRDGPQPAGLSR